LKVQKHLQQNSFETLKSSNNSYFQTHYLGENIKMALVEGSFKFCYFSGLHFKAPLLTIKSSPIGKKSPKLVSHPA
jgi:hypothetical protein